MRHAARVPPPLFWSSAFVAVAVASKNAIRRLWIWEFTFGWLLASSLKFLCFFGRFLLVFCKFSASVLPVLFFRSLWQDLCRSFALFLVSGGLGEYHNVIKEAMRRVIEAMPRVIENPSKWGLKRCQNPSKIMKNVTRGASGGVLGARLFPERKNELGLILFLLLFVPLEWFWVQFWGHWILKGIPKSHFFNINQHKMRKSEVPESVSKKHDLWMDCWCQNERPC